MDKGRCYLALGSNLGDKRANLSRAVSLIRERVGRVVCLSRFYETEPWGYASANTYLNAALEVETTLSPQEVLVITQAIERDLGREKKSMNIWNFQVFFLSLQTNIFIKPRIDSETTKIIPNFRQIIWKLSK